jgi:hypothetical protein
MEVELPQARQLTVEFGAQLLTGGAIKAQLHAADGAQAAVGNAG